MPGFAALPQSQRESLWRAADAELRTQIALRVGLPTAASAQDKIRYATPELNGIPASEIVSGSELYKRLMANGPGQRAFSQLPDELKRRLVLLNAMRGSLVPNPQYRFQNDQLNHERDQVRASVLQQLYGR